MNMMKKPIFLMQMNRLAAVLQFNPEEDVLLKEYFPPFQYFTDKRFAEVVEHLKNNYDNKFKFPQPADFWTAYRLTKKYQAPSTYKPEPRNDNAKNPLSFAYIQRSFKIQKTIRRQVFGDFIKNHPGKNSEDIEGFSHVIMLNFYSSKITMGEVFDIKNSVWAKKTRAVEQEDEEFWNPSAWGFKVIKKKDIPVALPETNDDLPF